MTDTLRCPSPVPQTPLPSGPAAPHGPEGGGARHRRRTACRPGRTAGRAAGRTAVLAAGRAASRTAVRVTGRVTGRIAGHVAARTAGGGRDARPRPYADAVAAVLALAALCCGIWLLSAGAGERPPPQPGAAQARSTRTTADPVAPALPPSPPERVRIPAIGVDAPLTGLSLNRSGSLRAPPSRPANLAGWYQDGTTPGARGTAVIAGHVDNADGPAVFYRLGALRRGHRIEVDRRDGTTAVFTVDAVEVYDKKHFPDSTVYGPAQRPELRVITCGGGWSEKTGYEGNVVVFARLTGSREPGTH